MSFRDELTEKRNMKQIYFVVDTLWVGDGRGTGTTSYMPNIRKSLNNKRIKGGWDDNFDSIVDNILRATENIKPTKVQGDTKLYTIPFYDENASIKRMDFNGGEYTIGGGDIKPTKNYYMTVNTYSGKKDGITIVNVFTKKNEALAWMRY